jgi:hypothetical protein
MAFAIYWVAYFIVEVIGVQAALLATYAIYTNYQSNYAAHRARKNAASISIDGRATMVRQPITVRKTIYGMSKTSGPLTFLNVSTSKNLYILITLTGHEIESIDDVYFNEDILDFDSSGNVIGKYINNAVVKKGLGSTAGDSDLLNFLMSECPDKWTSNHKQEGCAKLLVKLSPNRDIYASGIPNISCVVRGKKIYDPRTTLTKYTPNSSLCIRDYLISTVGALNSEIDDTILTAAANICDESVASASNPVNFTATQIQPTTVANNFNWAYSGGGTLSGPASFTYRITFYDASGETPGGPYSERRPIDEGMGGVELIDIPIGPSGVTGRKVYRDDLLVSTISDNVTTTYIDDGSDYVGTAIPITNTTATLSILERVSDSPCLRSGDAVTLTTTGTLPAPLSISTTYYYIYVGKLTGKLAATKSNAILGTEIAITTLGTGTHTIVRSSESRYLLDGPIDSDIVPKAALENMLTSCSGKLTNPGGIWSLLVGAYRTPTITFDENELDGPIKVSTMISKRELANGVKGVYIDPAQNWQPTDFPPVVNATYKTEDNNEQLWRDIELPFTISPSMSQRIAKIELERGRQQISTSWPCKLSALRVQIGDVVNLTNTRFGWSSKPFEISDLQFSIRTDGDSPRLGVDIAFRETASGVYDWNSGEETVLDLSPNTNLPNPFDIAEPSGLTADSGTAYLIKRLDGTIFTRVKLTWDAITDSDVTSGGRIEIEYRKSSSISVDWEKATSIPGTETTTYILDVEDGSNYFFRIRAVNNLGIRSSWAIIQHVIIGKTEPPSDVTGLAFTDTVLSWTPGTDFDLKGYIVRYRIDGGTIWESATPAHGNAYITDAQYSTMYLVGGSVKMLVKAIDTTGNESLNAATFDIDLRPGTPTQFSVTRQADGTREYYADLSPSPSDLDGFVIRYYLGSTSDWSSMSSAHDGVQKVFPFENNQLAAGTYTMACKAVDTAGNESATATFIDNVILGDPRIAGAIEDMNESTTGWPGTKVDCHIDTVPNIIIADGTGTWSSPATWSAMTSWNTSPVSPISYEREIDIGIITIFTALVTVLADGTQTITESHSNDGASWSSYSAISVPITARYIRVKVSIAGTFPIIYSMRTILLGKAETDYINDQDSSALTGSYRIGTGNVRVPLTKSFSLIQKVGITLQNVGPGWSWELIDKTTTYGPQIKIYNSSNTLADCVFDADVDGIL